MSNESMGYTELGSMKFHKETSKKKRNIDKDLIKKWSFIAVIVIAIVLIVFGMVKLVRGGSYESAIKKYIEFLNDSINGEVNERKLAKQYPKFMAETIEEHGDDLEEVIEYISDELEIESAIFTYEVIDKERSNDEEIEEYQNKISEFVGEDEKVRVQKGYCFNVKIKFKLVEKENGDEIEDDTWEENVDIVVLKCNGKTGVWKIDGFYIWDV